MGLDMITRKKICGKIFKRYQNASKKNKARILDEYAPLLEYNRDYLANLLTNWGKTRYAFSKGKPVKFIAKPAMKGFQK
jgi:3-methyladenine DNA glycosylase AlkD